MKSRRVLPFQRRAKRASARKTLEKYHGSLCCWCGRPMQTTDQRAWDYRTIEHLRPRSVGGKDELSNLAYAHAKCNSGRPRGQVDSPRYGMHARGKNRAREG